MHYLKSLRHLKPLLMLLALQVVLTPVSHAKRGGNGGGKDGQQSSGTPPVVSFTTSSFSIDAGQNFSVAVQASDSDGRVQRCALKVGGSSYSDRYAPYEWYGPRDAALTNMAAGSYTLTVSCRDDSRQTTTISKTLVVNATNSDTTAPTLSLPSDLVTEATSSTGAKVLFNASASDDSDSSPSVACSPASGSTFPLGATTVNCSASDSSGNASRDSFVVSVRDTTKPQIYQPSTISAESSNGLPISINFAISAFDTVDGQVTVNCAPTSGSLFPVGQTNVSCNSVDSAGNQANGSFLVSVADTSTRDIEAPLITVPDDLVLTSDNGESQTVNYAVSATDNIDGETAVFCLPASGELFAVGDTTVICSATDNSGNTAEASFLVSVTSTPVVVTRTVQLQWNIPVSRSDGSPLSPTELQSYTLAYSTNASLDAATIVDIPANDQSGVLVSEYTVTLPNAGSYYLGMTASDKSGNMSDISEIVAISVQ